MESALVTEQRCNCNEQIVREERVSERGRVEEGEEGFKESAAQIAISEPVRVTHTRE